jgi:pimeloyl-ACP methyl ester carboxylesterase
MKRHQRATPDSMQGDVPCSSQTEPHLDQFQRQTFIQGQTWNVFVAGSGPAVVFLHNGGGTLWNWTYQLEHFSSAYRVIAPDLPGFGNSCRYSTPLRLDDYVQGLSELLTVLDCPDAILVGNCIGASIALEFALRQPERVRALALFNVCGGLPMLNPRLRFWAAVRPVSSLGRLLHQALMNAASHPNLRRLGDSFLYADHEPELHPMIKRSIQRQDADPRLRPSLYWLVMGLESFRIFSQVRQRPAAFPPVLLAWGEQNKTLDPMWAQLIAGWLAPDRFWLISNAGHLPMYERPELVNQVLASFFLPNQKC